MIYAYKLQNKLWGYLSFLNKFVYRIYSSMLSAANVENIEKMPPIHESINSAQIKEQAGQLMDSYGNSVLRLAYSYLHNMSDAEDVLQDTLIQFLKTQPHFETAKHEKAWFMRVTINISKNKIKYNNIRNTDELMETLTAAKSEDLTFVWDSVKQLPTKYREVVHLYYYEGYDTAQIASLLSKNKSTVRSLLKRARVKLKYVLKEVYDFEE